MPNERIIPSDQPKSVATYTILSGGAEVSRTYNLASLVVNKEFNRIASATIIFVDGDPAKESFEISNKAEFEPGKEIEIKLGYRSDEETVFKGIVIKHGIKIRKGASLLVVDCKDKAAKMTVSCKSKYFKDATDSDAIEEIIDTYGLEKDVTGTSVTHPHLVQYNATDWDFIQCRAEMNGLLSLTNDGKLEIKKPEFSGEATLTIQYGATIHHLDAEIDARQQYKAVKGSTWNYSSQELSDAAEGADPGVPDAGNLAADTLSDVIGEEEFMLFHGGKIADTEMQAWVDAALMKHRLAKIRGKVHTDGTAAVIPGKLIQLNGVGERFEGKLFVTGVQHQLTKGNWETILQFGLNPEWFTQKYDIQQPKAGGLLPAIQGLQVGIVTKLEGDPDGEDRIQVRVSIIHKEDEGAWCRLSTLDAGENRGTFFRPEIEDEVIVGFINNDPRHGVVLGMVHSSSKPSPLPATDDNHIKGYVSRSEMKMTFDDDKKVWQLETPAGNKVIVSEDEKQIHLEDQHGNKLTMNQDGITLESIKDIIMKATGDLKAEGVNADIKGSASAKVSASGAECSLAGTATLKGSVVNIN